MLNIQKYRLIKAAAESAVDPIDLLKEKFTPSELRTPKVLADNTDELNKITAEVTSDNFINPTKAPGFYVRSRLTDLAKYLRSNIGKNPMTVHEDPKFTDTEATENLRNILKVNPDILNKIKTRLTANIPSLGKMAALQQPTQSPEVLDSAQKQMELAHSSKQSEDKMNLQRDQFEQKMQFEKEKESQKLQHSQAQQQMKAQQSQADMQRKQQEQQVMAEQKKKDQAEQAQIKQQEAEVKAQQDAVKEEQDKQREAIEKEQEKQEEQQKAQLKTQYMTEADSIDAKLKALHPLQKAKLRGSPKIQELVERRNYLRNMSKHI